MTLPVFSPSASRRRRVWLGLLAGGLLIVIAGVVVDLWAGRQIRREIARLEAKYGSFDGRSVSAPPVPAKDNRARIVRAAAALVSPGLTDEGWSAVKDAAGRFSREPAATPVPDELRTFVEENQAALALAAEAARRRQSSWDTDYAGHSGLPPWIDVRTLSDAFAVSAALEIEHGRPDAAASSIASGLVIAASIRQEPSLIAQLIRISVLVRHAEGVMRLLDASEPSPDALEALSRHLAENREPVPMQAGLLGEVRMGNAALRNMEQGQLQQLPDLVDSSPWAGLLARLGRPWLRLLRLRYLRHVERLLEIQAGPRPLPSLPGALRGFSSRPRRLTEGLTAGLSRAMETTDQAMSTLGGAEVAVALRRYRLDRGTYPDTLQALVPHYLTHVPIDPTTGASPAYSRREAGFSLRAWAFGGPEQEPQAADWTVTR